MSFWLTENKQSFTQVIWFSYLKRWLYYWCRFTIQYIVVKDNGCPVMLFMCKMITRGKLEAAEGLTVCSCSLSLWPLTFLPGHPASRELFLCYESRMQLQSVKILFVLFLFIRLTFDLLFAWQIANRNISLVLLILHISRTVFVYFGGFQADKNKYWGE